jgi:hypothetical protein
MLNLPQRIAKLINSSLHLRIFLPLLALALATTWYGLFWSVEYFSALTGGLSFMDMQPMLTADALFEQIRTYSDETVAFYLVWSAFDYAWPLITFTTMLFITAWLFGFTSGYWQAKFWLLVTAAYATVLMDWLENIGFALLLTGLPDEPLWLAQLSLGLHMAKLFFNMVFNLGFWVLLLSVIVIRTRKLITD